MQMLRLFTDSFRRGCRQLVSRRVYLFTILLVPVIFIFFFTNLMEMQLPLQVPVAMVDLDHSTLSRKVTRSLDAAETIHITHSVESYAQAQELVKSGAVYGFFLIPADFQARAVSGRGPELSFYANLAVFVPGTLAYKGFMQTAVSASGAVVSTKLTAMGMGGAQVSTMLQPMVLQTYPLHNPWMNYVIYLANSFVPALMSLLVMIVTCFSVTSEIKEGTSPEWLRVAGDSMPMALLGKLLPQTLLYWLVALMIYSGLYCWLHLPMNGSAWAMLAALGLLVTASQGFALFITCVLPNMRFSMSICSLVGILTFSLAGFSFPVDKMYTWLQALACCCPMRWYFLIAVDQALNGIPLYYSRWYYVWLTVMTVLPVTAMWKLRRHCLHPVYVP